MSELLNIESFINLEIKSIIKSIQNINTEEEIKNKENNLNKIQIEEIKEKLNKIKSFLFKFSEFSNTNEISNSLNDENLKNIEKKWYLKNEEKNNQWKTIKLNKRLYGFLTPEKNSDAWNDDRVDEFINSIKKY